MQRLIKFGLTLDKIQNISEPELKELIRETRFNNTKVFLFNYFILIKKYKKI